MTDAVPIGSNLVTDPTTMEILGGNRLAAKQSGGTGNVTGPASAVDGHLAVFDGTTGKLIKDGGAVPGGGITQLTGRVTAGPGSGSQVASLSASGVTAGSYTNANITVAADGTLSAASDGTGGGITGSGTTNTVPKFTGSTAVGNSIVVDDPVAGFSVTGANGTVSQPGQSITITSGNDGSTGAQGGGAVLIKSGSDVSGGGASNVTLQAGNDAVGGGAGDVVGQGGDSFTTGQPGGACEFFGGTAHVGNAHGGDFIIRLGSGVGTGAGGQIDGQIKINTDPSLIACSLSWLPGDTLNGRTILTTGRRLAVTAVIVRIDAANGTAATLLVTSAGSGTSFSGGVHLTSNTADLTGTVNTNQVLTLSTTASDLVIAAGSSFGLVSTGTLAASAGCVTVWATPQ